MRLRISPWDRRRKIGRFALSAVFLLLLSMAPLASTSAETASTNRYIVVFSGEQAADGTFALGGDYALNHEAAVSLVESAGGTVSSDLTREIGVMIVESDNALFSSLVADSPLVEAVGTDFGWKQFPTLQEALDSGALTLVDPESVPGGGPEETQDALELLQWDMMMIHAPQAHSVQAGARVVDVGVLDTGIDMAHADFLDVDGITNIDAARSRDFTFVGTHNPYTDNGFHGTHVAGTIAARANQLGIVGVAPNVTLVSVKVCDTSGYCYASPVIEGITYAGQIQLDVINMSFFVDDNELLQSTEFKCNNVEQQRAFRRAVERAIQYARSQGVTPVAALGNSDKDLAHPVEGNECEVVPAETQGVVGTMSLGRDSEKAGYSNYGSGATDVAAPGGNFSRAAHPVSQFCERQILSTIPGNLYGCFQGTSMASPHAAGVAALIVSQYGTLGSDGDVKISPTKVEQILQSTTIDIGLKGYDECFGNGRVDAARAVLGDTSYHYEDNPPCPEYAE